MTLGLAAAVGVGGALGAPARYLVDRWITARSASAMPWGTLAINLSGAALLGLLEGLLLHHHLSPGTQAFAATGFCGAYTTFSTFTFEVLSLLDNRRLRLAGLYTGASLVVGLAAGGAGLALGLAL